ncbi:hypothetical protein GQ42DRAFT_164802 [Ramicandelaber brevisporus]|nr:hypothetical protein GQ42DRAFT_164802 [Ramicandelaber brevisporus]
MAVVASGAMPTSNADAVFTPSYRFEVADRTHLANRLRRGLGPEVLATRPAPGGQRLSYLEGWRAINTANQLFDFDGWSSQIVELTVDYCDMINNAFNIGVSCVVRITLPGGQSHEDIGYGSIENIRSKAQGFEKAKKESVTDALKRALRTFGNAMGNIVYDKAFLKRIARISAEKVQPLDSLTLIRGNDNLSLVPVPDDSQLPEDHTLDMHKRLGTGSSEATSGFSEGERARIRVLLRRRLGPEMLASRPAPGGQKLMYLESFRVFNLANDIFGFDGWSSRIMCMRDDFCDMNQNGNHNIGISCIVRVTLANGSFREDVGFGSIENVKSKALGFEKAKKEAVTDATKRCLRMFGDALGNCLYDKNYLRQIIKVKAIPLPDMDEKMLIRSADSIDISKPPPIPTNPAQLNFNVPMPPSTLTSQANVMGPVPTGIDQASWQPSQSAALSASNQGKVDDFDFDDDMAFSDDFEAILAEDAEFDRPDIEAGLIGATPAAHMGLGPQGQASAPAGAQRSAARRLVP